MFGAEMIERPVSREYQSRIAVIGAPWNSKSMTACSEDWASRAGAESGDVGGGVGSAGGAGFWPTAGAVELRGGRVGGGTGATAAGGGGGPAGCGDGACATAGGGVFDGGCRMSWSSFGMPLVAVVASSVSSVSASWSVLVWETVLVPSAAYATLRSRLPARMASHVDTATLNKLNFSFLTYPPRRNGIRRTPGCMGIGPGGCPGCAGWPRADGPPGAAAAPVPGLASNTNVATSRSCFRMSLVGPFSDFSIFTTFTVPMLSPSALKSTCLV